MSRHQRRRPFALLGAASLASLLLAEGLLRLVGFEFDQAPDRVEFGWPDPTVIDPGYAHDPELFWVPADHAAKLERLRAERPAVLFLGDSCTEYSRYPTLVLERLGAGVPGGAPRGGKLATAGWSSFQGRRLLERDALPLRPRVVTIYFGWNDHWDAYGTEDARVAELALTEPLRRWRLAQLAHRVRVWLYRHRVWQGKESEASRPKRVSPPDFEANLAAMVQAARRQHVVPVLITAPTSHEKGSEPEYLEKHWLRDLSELVPIHQHYVAIVRHVAKRSGALLCDLEAHFAALEPDEREGAFGQDGIHLTPAGELILADALAECLLAEREVRLALAGSLAGAAPETR